MCLRADINYQAYAAEGIIITGVRSDSPESDAVILTASQVSGGLTTAALYQGSLASSPGAALSGWSVMSPVFAGQTVTSSTFYGPNTSLFSSSIPNGQVRAVGSYKYDEGTSGPNMNHGMMYVGPVSGGGTWTQLDATSLVQEGTLMNTLAHSNMGNLVVGNYDTSLATGMAFIYDITDQSWLNLNPSGSASVTAYGIWQNSETSYTIAGGASDLEGGDLDYAYLLNYDSNTQEISNFTKFHYNNHPMESLITHFDGITRTEDGFNLTGDYVMPGGEGAFMATVSFDELSGVFGEATWTEIAYPGAETTSGNTIIGNSVLGIFVVDGDSISYLATVPEPRSALIFACAAALLISRRRKS